MLTARDARRFVAGTVLAAATVFFVVFYPNIAALPLPSTIFNAYQGILPTWLYPFQFPDNTDPAVAGQPLFSLVPILTGLMLTVSAWSSATARGRPGSPAGAGTVGRRQRRPAPAIAIGHDRPRARSRRPRPAPATLPAVQVRIRSAPAAP